MLNFNKILTKRGLLINKFINKPKYFNNNNNVAVSILGNRSIFTKTPICLMNNNNNNNNYNNTTQPPQQQQQELIFPPKNHKEEIKEITLESIEPKPLVKELDSRNFNEITMKTTVPLILNVYSEKGTISPALTEALKGYAEEYPGCILIANLNVEKNIELVKALKVDNIPTMYTMHKGQVLQQFVGLPDHESLDRIVTEMIKLSGGLLGGKTIEQQHQIAELYLRSNQTQESIAIYKSLLENDTTQQLRTLIGLAQCYTNLNDLNSFDEIIQLIKDKFSTEFKNGIKKIQVCQRILNLKKQVEIIINESLINDIPIEQFEQSLIDEPNNLDIKYDLSLLYFQNGDYKNSINQLLEILKINKSYTRGLVLSTDNNNNNNDQSIDSAKNILIKIFESLDNQDPLLIKSRKILNNIWFS